MGHIVLSLAMSASGFVFAFFRGWLLTLIIISAFPIILMVTYFLTKQLKGGFSESQKVYGDCFGHAE
jgi:ABC-type multidrug transport system fused ATPase/permease subunit